MMYILAAGLNSKKGFIVNLKLHETGKIIISHLYYFTSAICINDIR